MRVGLEHGIEDGGRRVAEAVGAEHGVEELGGGVLGARDQVLPEDLLRDGEAAGFGEDVEHDGVGVEGVGRGGAVGEAPSVELEREDGIVAKAEEDVGGAEGCEGRG